ncbi:hypothetical protein IH982_02495 [Patescibacteria group bacterium]|nr:hypothetical protein [Patescibacteria group bacterium]
MKRHLLIGFLLAALGIALAGRLIPHPPNFTPVGALALFAGIYLARKSRWALVLPLAVMFLADLVIGFYDVKLMLVVYGSFLFYGIFGLLIKGRKNLGTITLATLAGSFLFYLFTNFAVWAFSPLYAPTLEGLMLSYTMGLPFLKYTLLGDLFFVGVFVGAYELALAVLHRKQFFLNEIKESLISLRRY